MNFQGDFEGLSLAGIFQLICNDEKTGVLTLTCNDEKSRVFFDRGTIVYADDSMKEKRLVDLLKTEGRVSEKQLNRCRDLAEQQGRDLGRTLAENGYISHETLETFNRREIETIIYNLFLSGQGEFDYKDQSLDMAGMVVTRMNPVKLILDASRRVDEFSEQMKACIRSDNAIYKISGKVPDKEKIHLSSNEWQILSLVDGFRTLGQIVLQSGCDEFSVHKILFSMISLGMVVEKRNGFSKPSGPGPDPP